MIYLACFVIILGLAYIWHFYSSDYQALITNITRDRLFQVRDSLFDAALNGDVAFDDKAYGMTRKTINGLIADCANLNLTQLLVSITVHRMFNDSFKKLQDDYQQTLDDALNVLSANGRKIITDIRMSMHIAVLTHIIKSSAVLWPLFITAMLISSVFTGATNLGKFAMSCFSNKRLFIAIDTHAKVHC